MTFAITLGRFLLGLYFFLPGISKITGYADTLSYMSLHNMPLPEVLLPVTIGLQVAGGLMLMLALRVGQVALVLAALTLNINIGRHDFGTCMRVSARHTRRRTSLKTWLFSLVYWCFTVPRAYPSTAYSAVVRQGY